MGWMIKKPKITITFLMLLLIVGLITYFQLPKREIPEFTFDISTITTVYPGATPESVERNVTVPLEEQLSSVEGIKEMTSVSAAGISTIVLQLDEQANKEATISKIRQSVSDVSSQFSSEIQVPNIREDIQMGALNSYHLLANDRNDLYELGKILSNWQKEIESINGVRGTIIKGVPDHELVIALNSEEMAQKGTFFPKVMEALNAEFKTVPLGKEQVDENIQQLQLQTYQSTVDIENVFVGLTRLNEPVYLRDIGTVSVRQKQPIDIITYEGTPALSFTVLPEQGVDIPSVHKAVDDKIYELKQNLPSSISVDLFYTQNTIVEQIFKDLTFSFILSIFAVIFITVLGLKASSAFIVALAIPTSVVLGLIPLPYIGVDLNQISIVGFIIALGILVDDAIVVNDNIERRYQLGDDPLTGALNGTKEVRKSIITSTLAVVFTFFPLLFLSGGNGDFIKALPTVLITTIVASTVVSLTVVPIYMSWRKNKYDSRNGCEKIKDQKIGLLGNYIDAFSNWYGSKVLGKVVKSPRKISIIGLIICTAVYGLIPFMPFVFFPSADREEVTVDVTLPVGVTLDQTNEYLFEMADYIQKDNAVEEVSVYAGAGLPGLFGQMMAGSGNHTGQLLIRVDREKSSADELISTMTPKLQRDFTIAQIKMTTIETGPPTGAPIAIKISGPEIIKLIDISEAIKSEITLMSSSGMVVDDIGAPWPTTVFEPKREKLAEHGITLKEISEQIRLKTEGLPIGSFDDGLTNWDTRIVVDELKKGEELALDTLLLPSKRNRNEAYFSPPELISFDELLSEKETSQIQKIPHYEGERTITIRAYPGEADKAQLEAKINDIIGQFSDFKEYSIVVGGETEAQTEFFIEITKLFFIVIFLIYIVMAIQFYSLVTPLLVMSTVYLAISGAVLGLFLTQVGIGFMAVMGIVSLAGIVVRNSIVLIEFIEQRLREGYELYEAVQEAGKVRLRPILLTAFTAIAALIPISFSGDVLFQPLAISIISGLLFSTVFTVILVPAFYIALHQKNR